MNIDFTLPIQGIAMQSMDQLRKRTFLILAIFMVAGITTFAQSQEKKGLSKLDSIFASKREQERYDTTFLKRPPGELTLKTRINLSGNGIHARGTVNDIYSTADLHTKNKLTTSVAAIYKGIGVGMALNPAKIFGHYDDFELNLNFYGTPISVDASYQKSTSLSGKIERGGNHFHLEKGNTDMKVLNVVGYYAFNHRRFSYAAAFTQSYIQKRSAGSWLAGIAYQGGTVETDPNAPESMPRLSIRAQHLGIGGGYGYNLVLHEKWLIHLSILPTVVVLNNNKLTINGERKSAQPMRLNLIMNERFAVVYNLSPHRFISLTAVMNNTLFDDELVIINQNKWRVRAALGFRI